MPRAHDHLTDTQPSLLLRVQNYLRGRSSGFPAAHSCEDAWEAFYCLYDTVIRRFAVRAGVDPRHLEGCVQEVWKEIVVRLPGFVYRPQECRFRSWLFRIVRGKAADANRRADRDACSTLSGDVEPADSCTEPSEALSAREEESVLRELLAKFCEELSATRYQVFYLRAVVGLDTSAVADRLNLRPEEVRVWLHRARRRFERLVRRRLAEGQKEK